jgi:hypothetical protein
MVMALNATVPCVSNADGLPIEAARTVTPFGITDRQARFLVTVMLHSGVFVGRQYAAFAGITHGQKVHDFIERIPARRLVTAIELGSTGRTRIFRVQMPEQDASAADRARLRAARKAFRSPRFAAIRRHWWRKEIVPSSLGV